MMLQLFVSFNSCFFVSNHTSQKRALAVYSSSEFLSAIDYITSMYTFIPSVEGHISYMRRLFKQYQPSKRDGYVLCFSTTYVKIFLMGYQI